MPKLISGVSITNGAEETTALTWKNIQVRIIVCGKETRRLNVFPLTTEHFRSCSIFPLANGWMTTSMCFVPPAAIVPWDGDAATCAKPRFYRNDTVSAG
jgi:hypothetical protein